MKKLKSEKSFIKQNSKIAIAVTMLAVPMLYSPSTIFAQETKVKVESFRFPLQSPSFDNYLKRTGPEGKLSIVGLDNNKNVIYLNNKRELCRVDPQTGDFIFLPKDFKFTHDDSKHPTDVWLLGEDKNGIFIYKDDLGNKFSLNPNNGNKIPVK